MELIIDVSASAAAAGLARGGEVLWSGNLLTTRDHTTMLLPQILEGMTATGARAADITLVTVATGPGPFNGLRVALAIAKGIAVAGGIPVAGVNSLLAEVNRCRADVEQLRPIVPAGKTTYATALFCRDGTSRRQVDDSQVMSAVEITDIVSKNPVALCGDVDDGLRRVLQKDTSAHFVEPEWSRIEALAALGHERATAGEADPVATLQPIYVRPPHITKPRERRH